MDQAHRALEGAQWKALDRQNDEHGVDRVECPENTKIMEPKNDE